MRKPFAQAARVDFLVDEGSLSTITHMGMLRAISEDRRRLTRRALRRAVNLPCELVSKYVEEPLLYWASDLTPHGIWLETPAPMELGEQVVLCFQPTVWWHSRSLSLFAEVSRVLWSRAPSERGMALSFLDISQHEKRALSAWLRRRPPPLPKRRARSSSGRLLPMPNFLRAA